MFVFIISFGKGVGSRLDKSNVLNSLCNHSKYRNPCHSWSSVAILVSYLGMLFPLSWAFYVLLYSAVIVTWNQVCLYLFCTCVIKDFNI